MENFAGKKLFDELIDKYKADDLTLKYHRNFIVFDWDNTCAMYDVQHNVFLYQVENLLFKKEYFEEALIKDYHLDDFSVLIKDRIIELFNILINCNDFKKHPLYHDFVGMMLYFYTELSKTLSYEEACFRILYLFAGMSEEEVRKISYEGIKEAHNKIVGIKKYSFTFNKKRYELEFKEGLIGLTAIQDSFKRLKENNIDVYICSASMKITVEEFAKDFGFNLSSEYIYGLYLNKKDGIFIMEKNPDKIDTFLEGKAEVLRVLEEKYHKPPLLYMGDSSGDYYALTYPALKYAIIVDLDTKGKINELKKLAKTNKSFFLQKRDDENHRYI